MTTEIFPWAVMRVAAERARRTRLLVYMLMNDLGMYGVKIWPARMIERSTESPGYQ